MRWKPAFLGQGLPITARLSSILPAVSHNAIGLEGEEVTTAVRPDLQFRHKQQACFSLREAEPFEVVCRMS